MPHHHQVDEEDDKYDQESDIEQRIFDQGSQELLPDAEIAGQHIRLAQGQNYPWEREEKGGTEKRISFKLL